MRDQRALFHRLPVAACAMMLAGPALTLAGCGDGRVARYPVTGSVLVNGKPADGAMVIFCPMEGGDDAMRQRPFGAADAAGKFSLTTFERGDGAPAGEYKVLIQWPAASQNPQDERGGGRTGPGPDRLRGKYFNLERSTLTASVEEHPNDLAPFELKFP